MVLPTESWLIESSRGFSSWTRRKPLRRFPEFVSSAGGLEQGLDSLYDASGMLSEQTRLGLLDASPADHRASEDPWMRLAVAMEDWQDAQRNEDEARRGAMIRLRPRYVEALKEMKGGDFYSDANGTLRLSFGEVAGYSPQEAVQYAPQTSLVGLLAKGGEGEFEVDAELGASGRCDGRGDCGSHSGGFSQHTRQHGEAIRARRPSTEKASWWGGSLIGIGMRWPQTGSLIRR